MVTVALEELHIVHAREGPRPRCLCLPARRQRQSTWGPRRRGRAGARGSGCASVHRACPSDTLPPHVGGAMRERPGGGGWSDGATDRQRCGAMVVIATMDEGGPNQRKEEAVHG